MKKQAKKSSFIKLTKLDGSPIWLNASFVVTIEPRKGGGSVVVPIGDGLDYDVREPPEAVLAVLDGAPVPEVVPVPTSDALTPTPDDVSPEGGDSSDEKQEEGAEEEKPAKKSSRRAAPRKRAAAEAQVTPNFVASPAADSVVNLLDDELSRLRKMAPRTVKKLQNTIMTQFKSVNADAAVTSLVTRGIITIDGTHVNWLQPESAVKMETVGPAAEDEKAEKQKTEKGSKGDE